MFRVFSWREGNELRSEVEDITSKERNRKGKKGIVKIDARKEGNITKKKKTLERDECWDIREGNEGEGLRGEKKWWKGRERKRKGKETKTKGKGKRGEVNKRKRKEWNE